MKLRRVSNQAAVDACKEIYFKYGGCDHRRIESEMRDAGWKFSRRSLLPRYSEGKMISPGWVKRFGWDEELEERCHASAMREAELVGTFGRWLEADPGGMTWTARHHEFIRQHLDSVTGSRSKRMMLFVPPRHGKSEMVTVRYAAWRLIREPGLNIIIGCYNQKLANRFSRKIKRLVETRVEISRSRHSAAEWETAVGGGVKAVGVGAGITGFGGDLIILDDPVKGRAAANSALLRDKTWDWYNDDIHTRLEPGAAIILIQTRWHDDDLAGRLLKEMQDGGEQWEVVRLPALAELGSTGLLSEPPALAGGAAPNENPASDGVLAGSPPRQPAENAVCHPSLDKEVRVDVLRVEVDRGFDGTGSAPPADAGGTDLDPLGRLEGEASWPERFDREVLLAKRRQMGPWSFAALYQQRPVPEGGTLFKMEWFRRRVRNVPSGLKWCRGYDLAISVKTSADYTASFRCAFDKNGDLYIADGFRQRIEYPEQRNYVLGRLEAEPDTVHGIELALHGQALVQELRREPKARGRVLRGLKVDGDKLVRAGSWAALAEEGRVVLVDGPWVHDFLDEVCRFTGRGDTHDDQVDAVSLAVRMLRGGKGLKTFD